MNGAVVRVDLDVVKQGILGQVNHGVDVGVHGRVHPHQFQVLLAQHLLVVDIFQLERIIQGNSDHTSYCELHMYAYIVGIYIHV